MCINWICEQLFLIRPCLLEPLQIPYESFCDGSIVGCASVSQRVRASIEIDFEIHLSDLKVLQRLKRPSKTEKKISSQNLSLHS